MRSEMTGLVISTDAASVAGAVDDLTRELLRYGDGAGRFFAAAEQDPDCALANALCAALHLFTLTREGAARALPYLRRAEAKAATASARERQFVAAVADWGAGRIDAAIARHLHILERWPTDILSLKLVTYHQLNRGAFADMLRTIRSVLPANRRNSHVQGMYAFALSQTGRYREAEAAGRRAAAAAPDPWAQHAVAHVLDLSGAAEEGRAFMLGHAADWEACSSFLYTHNWWHAALFMLALGDTPGALRLFDERVWARRRDACQDQINAASLLARLELAGVDVGDRWDGIADQAERRTGDHLNGFLDLHYTMALARAGREAKLTELMAGLQGPEVTAAHRDATAGIAAWGKGDFRAAAERLAPVRDRLVQLGGSDVQRELFDLILVQSLGRSGRVLEARVLDNERRGRRAEAAWQRQAVASGIHAGPRRARGGG